MLRCRRVGSWAATIGDNCPLFHVQVLEKIGLVRGGMARGPGDPADVVWGDLEKSVNSLFPFPTRLFFLPRRSRRGSLFHVNATKTC